MSLGYTTKLFIYFDNTVDYQAKMYLSFTIISNKFRLSKYIIFAGCFILLFNISFSTSRSQIFAFIVNKLLKVPVIVYKVFITTFNLRLYKYFCSIILFEIVFSLYPLILSCEYHWNFLAHIHTHTERWNPKSIQCAKARAKSWYLIRKRLLDYLLIKTNNKQTLSQTTS